MGGIYVGLTLMLTFNMVVGTGRFEVSILAIFNESGQMSDGNCCSESRDNGSCSSLCNTFFSVCLQHHSLDIPEFPRCTYGRVVTPVFNFSASNDTIVTKNKYLVKIPFQFSWPETFSLVIDAWRDIHPDFSTEDVSNRLLRAVATDKLKPPSQWAKRKAKADQLEIYYKYRVICDEFYYSDTCEQICRHRNDNFGHYVCDETGSKVCLPGWQGEFCQEAVCTEKCNSSRGYCENPFECRCFLGWTGKSCDKCIPNPGCVNGFCYEPWQCICRSGWGGRYCDIDQHYCTNYRPCKNGGTCLNNARKNFTCVCSTGYTGRTCENEVCFDIHCQNGGKCQGTSEGDAKCVCLEGYHGRYCQHKKSFCKDMICANSGTCTNGKYGAYCSCLAGFEGKHCESEIDECRSNPCANGGTCLDGVNDFICRCKENYMGKTCGIIMDPCYGIKCFNGGRCHTTAGFRANCKCPQGFFGKRCESKIDMCKNIKCQNGGSCLKNGTEDYSCICLYGFHGDLCELSVQSCTPSSCQNGGICKQYRNYTSCICPSEFIGEKCESSVIDFEGKISGPFPQNLCAKCQVDVCWTLFFILLNFLIPP
ncbi:neurogenic locus protein delta-like [Saccostrea echinata]|uniref:neurogenic locus protein delta-like n=1 Tax=Saccostrea echinata TaxID=191078 RepID=UPI002A8417D3|nr:neurogenic locus protein delta-like [Saccostrea echinata]XP_061164291.1 neurogenic locus protein delta-like [Saccostrea echinata]